MSDCIEVIRCQHCKWWAENKHLDKEGAGSCHNPDWITEWVAPITFKNWYCSQAERRDA